MDQFQGNGFHGNTILFSQLSHQQENFSGKVILDIK